MSARLLCTIRSRPAAGILILLFAAGTLRAQGPAKITLQLDQPGKPVSPRLYGLMTEEINFSYEGGLYGELIRNRTFKDSVKTAAFWSLVAGTGSEGSVALDRVNALNEALPVSLRLDVLKAGDRIGIGNEGYWGIPVKPGALYKGSFFSRCQLPGQSLTVSIESPDGKMVYATGQVGGIDTGWRKYSFSLSTVTDAKPTADARFVISAKKEGSYWFSAVSLFPPTYKDRANGLRPDLMQLLADMQPAFLRFPGGNYVEGNTFSSRWDWKRTIGPVESRPGHLSPWRYRSTDGMGLLEFLDWCEDLHMEPLLAVFAGYTLNKDYLEAGPFLQPFVDDALDEIEYVTGDVSTKWGAQRAKDGHPQPFVLKYIEVGNEDGFDLSGSYGRRYAQFYDAIKAKYPQLQVISTVGGKDPIGGRFPALAGKAEIVDEHYYRTASQMEENAGQYDHYDRNGPKIFVGEWATREGDPTTNFNAALGDAAWMTGMERNSDLVLMSSYAPLFVNVNPGGMQWKSDLIGYNTMSSFGSPSYYAQKLFATHLGDVIVPVTTENIPTQLSKVTGRDSVAGVKPKMIDALFVSATRDTRKNILYLKIVNAQGVAQAAAISLPGAAKISRDGMVWTLKAATPTETNTISDPVKIVPIETRIKGVGKTFEQTLPPYSIVVVQITAG
jgi:alpha-L-arabinofuranosidase